MRLFYGIMTMVILLLFTSEVLADAAMAKHYYTTKRLHKLPAEKTTLPATVLSGLKSYIHPLTNITVINASVDTIYAVVTANNIYQLYQAVYPRGYLHIYEDDLFDPTYLVLKDPYSNDFFSGYVCRRAIITVFGQPGSYLVQNDRDFCDN